ncbi:hypothetical protein F7725_026033 [Dissostichus mawsoni]|uniref:Uncharacterized protein n=1 Tax=Dissostichus mawsoni TaxID=36200 RepID=A0A7J5X7F2_DISMA|nr:hypothetical protein F7725_026033 [Dissostichus mawsoni]
MFSKKQPLVFPNSKQPNGTFKSQSLPISLSFFLCLTLLSVFLLCLCLFTVMSDSDLEDLLRSADELVEQKELGMTYGVLMICFVSGSSSRNSSASSANGVLEEVRHRNTDPPVDAPDPDCNLVSAPAIAPETVEGFLRDLQQSLSDTTGDEVVAQTPSASLLASTNWSIEKSWRAARPHLVNTVVAQANVGTHICQQCWSKTSVVRCRDCRPHPFFCADCDVSMHTRHPLHNRDATTAGYFQPLAPTHIY